VKDETGVFLVTPPRQIIFLFISINSLYKIRGFVLIVPYMHIMYFDYIYPLSISPLSSCYFNISGN
jgi:hypothetical protein